MKSAWIFAALVAGTATPGLAAPQDVSKPTATTSQAQPTIKPSTVGPAANPNVVAPIDLKSRVQVPMVCTTGIIGEESSKGVIGEKIIGEKVIGEKSSDRVIGEKIIGEKGSGKIIGEKGSEEVIGEKSTEPKKC